MLRNVAMPTGNSSMPLQTRQMGTSSSVARNCEMIETSLNSPGKWKKI